MSWRRGRRKPRSTEHPAELSLVVEDVQTGYVGAVVRVEYGRVYLEDRRGHMRGFPLGPGYFSRGRPVILTAPRRTAPAAAGDRVRFGRRVGCPRPGRAGLPHLRRRSPRRRLVAQVWGEDLRIEGVVVEQLGGVDDLVEIVAEFARAGAPSWGCLSTTLSRVRRRRGSPMRCGGARRHRHPGRRSSLRRHLAGRETAAVGAGRLAQGAAAGGVEARRVPGAQPAAQRSGGHRQGLAAHPFAGSRLERLKPALISRVEELIDFVTAPVC